MAVITAVETNVAMAKAMTKTVGLVMAGVDAIEIWLSPRPIAGLQSRGTAVAVAVRDHNCRDGHGHDQPAAAATATAISVEGIN